MPDIVVQVRLTDGAKQLPLASVQHIRCPIDGKFGYACK